MPPEADAILTLTDVRYGFASRPDFLGPVSVAVRRGECWAIVGPNGAGKTTLLRLMAGLSRPRAGRIDLAGEGLSTVPMRRRAKRVAFVPQQAPRDVDLCVRDVVLMGRFPHRTLGLFESTEDFVIADRAMRLTQTLPFADRPIATLSGGEAQRVHIAAALTQEPELILLDEPTASLDLVHQLGIFGLLRERTARGDLAAVIVTHDVNLAARFCSRALVLDEGRVVAAGPPRDVLTPAVLEPVYGVSLTTLSAGADASLRWLVPVDVAGEVRS